MSGMTLWHASIEKTDTFESWSNVYTLSASTLAAAVSIGQGIVNIEKAVHKDYIRFLTLTVEPAILGAGGGTVVGLSGVGVVASSGERMPLFVTARVRLRPATGKPSQKYLRLPLGETEVANDVIAGGVLTLLQTSYLAPLLGTSGLVDPQGQTFVTGDVVPHVQERQLRRRRRARPGMKRGWVPA